MQPIPSAATTASISNTLQIRAVNRKLQVFEPRGAPERLLADELAKPIKKVPLAGRDSMPCQRLRQPKNCQFAGRMRQQIDSDADRLKLPRRLKNAAANADARKRQGERQAADARPDDDDVVHARFPKGCR